MKVLVSILVLVAAAITWTAQRITTVDLETQVDALRMQNGEADALRRERDRLRQGQPDVSELANLQRDAAERGRIARELADRKNQSPSAVAGTIATSWAPASAWKNRGRASPSAAVETTLWAAAGGDVSALQSLLQLDDAARAQAESLFARLPESSRSLYSSPGHLIAAFTTKAIPLGEAQLVWQQESGPDEAAVCVFLRDRRRPNESPPVSSMPDESKNAPPMLPESGLSNSAYLTLRRSADGWRLVVPVSAVEKIAKELGSARAK